jgi:hypothetical protein
VDYLTVCSQAEVPAVEGILKADPLNRTIIGVMLQDVWLETYKNGQVVFENALSTPPNAVIHSRD